MTGQMCRGSRLMLWAATAILCLSQKGLKQFIFVLHSLSWCVAISPVPPILLYTGCVAGNQLLFGPHPQWKISKSLNDEIYCNTFFFLSPSRVLHNHLCMRIRWSFLRAVQLELVWQRAKQMHDLKAVVPVTVSSMQRAGFLCSFEDLPSLTAFLPASHSPDVRLRCHVWCHPCTSSFHSTKRDHRKRQNHGHTNCQDLKTMK